MRDDQFRLLMIASVFPAFYPRFAAAHGDTVHARDAAIASAKNTVAALLYPTPAPVEGARDGE